MKRSEPSFLAGEAFRPYPARVLAARKLVQGADVFLTNDTIISGLLVVVGKRLVISSVSRDYISGRIQAILHT